MSVQCVCEREMFGQREANMHESGQKQELCAWCVCMRERERKKTWIKEGEHEKSGIHARVN